MTIAYPEKARVIRPFDPEGLAAPVVTYGTGMGLREKLGPLRITIPADKDVLHLVVSRQDAQVAFDFMTDVARLHQPGRGFIYISPVRFGVINSRIYRGEVRHVASMEQVIAAIDTLKRDTGWRKKTTLPRARRERGYLRDLVSYTILGAESRVEELVRAALDAGAGGATVSALRAGGPAPESGEYVTRARQASDLIISASLVRPVHRAVLARGEPSADPTDFIELSEVEKASTYRHP
jgi:nitrogen regulatory protein PII